MIIQEFCNGGDLEQKIEREKKIPEKEARSILFQIVLGLKAIHEKGIAHRDMKELNVFITTRPQGGDIYQIGDFGQAKKEKKNCF